MKKFIVGKGRISHNFKTISNFDSLAQAIIFATNWNSKNNAGQGKPTAKVYEVAQNVGILPGQTPYNNRLQLRA